MKKHGIEVKVNKNILADKMSTLGAWIIIIGGALLLGSAIGLTAIAMY